MKAIRGGVTGITGDVAIKASDHTPRWDTPATDVSVTFQFIGSSSEEGDVWAFIRRSATRGRKLRMTLELVDK